MIVTVEGTRQFNDYEVFMRAMGVALSADYVDSRIEVWSAGPQNVNRFTAAFCNSSENYLKQKGFKISFKRFPISHIAANMGMVDYFAFFAKPNQRNSESKLLASAEYYQVETGIYKY
jgi:hypothetical protein